MDPLHRGGQALRTHQSRDKIAVCISGGKDSMLMAKLMQDAAPQRCALPAGLSRDGPPPTTRSTARRQRPSFSTSMTIFESNIFSVANNTDKNPSYLCPGIRAPPTQAKQVAATRSCGRPLQRCHRDHRHEYVLRSALQAMPPMLHTPFPGVTLIRPMYCIREEDILAWKRYDGAGIHPVRLPLH